MSTSFFSLTKLPSTDWDFYWNNIYLPDAIKRDALRLILAEYKLGSFNREFALSRTILFYGPPGCGKTATARGVSNEAAKAITHEQCYFAELSFHNLRSQDYGESEKLIAQAFKYVEEIASAGHVNFILFDEVESILTERQLTLSKANPVDAFRGVNEVLKGMDELSTKFQKTFCLATSNLLVAVDKAFVDRTDRVFFVDLPNYGARFQLLKEVCETTNKTLYAKLDVYCRKFRKLVYVTENLSGRQLRKLPIETISSSDKLSRDPSRIKIDDMIKAAENLKRNTLEKYSRNSKTSSALGGSPFGR
jgi:SpoVK/Ycf46/Vps4 family AAA+-type ATPase